MPVSRTLALEVRDLQQRSGARQPLARALRQAGAKLLGMRVSADAR